MTPVDPALVTRIAASIRSDVKPVRPMPSTNALVACLLAIFAAVSLGGAAILGFHGVRLLDLGAAFLIFAELLSLALLVSAASVSSMIPGSRRPMHPGALTLAACVVLATLFALVLPDRSMGSFVPQGIACFRAGMIWALPAALGTWLVLRRGFAIDRHAAGVAIGALSGLTGLAVLEFHCPNFRLPHVAVWHLGVLAVCAAAGYFFGSKRRDAELMQ